MRVIIVILTLLFFTTKTLEARPIISGISTNQINIDTKFTGTQVLLFGAKGDYGDVIIVVRGPEQNYIVSKKDKFFGIWYNKQRMKIKNAYGYYSFFSTAGNPKVSNKVFSDFGIGRDALKFDISSDYEDDIKNIFQSEFISNLEYKNLYTINPHKIEFLDETLFKVMIDFPKNIPSGIYTAEIYLIDENHLAALQSIPIYVNQVGFSADIHNMAYKHPVLYGIMAVLIAVIAGWMANLFFSRFFGK